ncbi:MAG: DUF4325 domain-containing protein [Methylococcaceae bacterium]
MYIVVKSITDLKTPQSCHGKNLSRLARECFANQQPLTVDFEGVQTITQAFFQELFLPLVAEFGADFLKSKLLVANIAPDIDEIMKSAFSNLDDYFDQRTIILNRDCDEEIYELNLAWLIKAREFTRENSILAELMLGITEEEMRSAISKLSIEDIQHIAQSGWLCFSPRFTTNFIQIMTTRQHEMVDVLLGLSGSL